MNGHDRTEAMVGTPTSLCQTCSRVREVVSGTGSRFLLCRLSQVEARFPKYPPQPVVGCDGYLEHRPGDEE
jgi:hypothetical protein